MAIPFSIKLWLLVSAASRVLGDLAQRATTSTSIFDANYIGLGTYDQTTAATCKF